MAVHVQQAAPDFQAQAVIGNEFKEIALSNYRGRYVVLFFYPLDFTFVCPTEIIAFSDRQAEFERRNCQLIGVSVDSQYTHLAWKRTPRSSGGLGDIYYPLVADITKSIAADYGVLLPGGIALRGLFLIDKNGIVRHVMINDLPLGRSVDETLRLLDALQHYEKHGDFCPANWQPGQPTVKPTPEGIQDYFAKHSQ